MKMTNRFRLLAGVLSVVTVLGSAQAKKAAADFTDFEGNYKGLVTNGTFGTDVYPIVANLNVKVPKSGKTATITLSGTLTASGMVYPLNATFQITKKTMVLSDLLLGISGPTASLSGSSHLNGKGTAISGTLLTPLQASLLGTASIRVQPQGKKKKKLTLTYQLGAGGSIAYSFPFVAVAKVKPGTED